MSVPGLDEWRRFLTDEMNILDKVWEDDLDDLWRFTPNDLARTIADYADEFYQRYWEVFRAVLQGNDGKKSWEDMKLEARNAASEAREYVSKAWATVVAHKIDLAERKLESLTGSSAPLINAKQAFRNAKTGYSKAEKRSTHGRHDDALAQFRESMGLIDRCEDEIDEAKRQHLVVIEQQNASRITISIRKRTLIVAVSSGFVALAVFILMLVKYFQSTTPGSP